MIYIYRIFIFLMITSITACVSHSNITAAGDEDKDIGIGGTGMMASTGVGLGGTGIAGVITGFGSIFVNGVEIEYDNKTPFTVDGKTATHQPLEIGDVVEVLTADAQQHTHARIINLRHEVIGKVESVSPETSSFTVLGQTILQAADAPLPEAGSNVAISGFRMDNKTIKATKVKPTTEMKTLLRTHTELPFSKKTSRWLIQAFTQYNKATVTIENLPHTFALTEAPGLSQIKIMQLHKSKTGELKFDHEVDNKHLQRGRKIPSPDLSPERNTNPMHRNNMRTTPRMGR